MKLSIIFATPDQNLRTFVGLRKDSLIPDSIRSKGYLGNTKCKFFINTLKIDNKSNAEEIAIYIHERASESDGVIFLIDHDFAHLVESMRDAVFVVSFPGSYGGKSLQNRVGSILAPTLRHYGHLSQRFYDGKFRKILLLPLEIFMAEELNQLRDLVVNNNMAAGFAESLDLLLSGFRDRQVPKRRATYPDKYIRDNRPLFFQYGHEEHSIVEKHPPHTSICILNSDFRFGNRYDSRRHFNVSEEDPNRQVSGDFLSCHGQRIVVTKRTHVNVFPNGFL